MRWRWAHVAQEAEHNLGKIEVPGSSPGVGSEGRCSSAVEQLFRKQQVVGSNPTTGSKENRTTTRNRKDGRAILISLYCNRDCSARGWTCRSTGGELVLATATSTE